MYVIVMMSVMHRTHLNQHCYQFFIVATYQEVRVKHIKKLNVQRNIYYDYLNSIVSLLVDKLQRYGRCGDAHVINRMFQVIYYV